MSERMLAALLPKQRAGACACTPADAYHQYRCIRENTFVRRRCTPDCYCNDRCGAWVTVGEC